MNQKEKIVAMTTPVSLIKHCAVIASILLLGGCYERHRTTDSLCESYPQICADTNIDDGQCRLQRTTLIWQRYDVLKNPTDAEKFKELKFTYDYQKCLEYAARIEPTELKERKTIRTQALLHAYDSIRRLNEELAQSDDPEILYFRLSQGDKTAMTKFLKLEGSEVLDSPDLQFALATIYIAKDQDKTVSFLLRALELYQPNQPIKPEIIQSLATLSHQKGNQDAAYLWARVGHELGMQTANIEKLDAFYPMPEQARLALVQKAQYVAKALRDGVFTARMAF